MFLIYTTIVSITALNFISDDFVRNTSHTAFLTYWGIANGPLAFAALTLGNSMVFHDKLNIASCFIHLTPCSFTWAMRWYQDRVIEHWPGIFNLHDPENCNKTFLEIILPPMAFYTIWWVPHTIFMLMKGRYYGESKEMIDVYGMKDTVYHDAMRGNKAIATKFGYNEDTFSHIAPFVKYQISHMLSVFLTICISYIFWNSFALHTIFCLSCFAYCANNGASRYNYIMTQSYHKSLEKLVKPKKEKVEEKEDAF